MPGNIFRMTHQVFDLVGAARGLSLRSGGSEGQVTRPPEAQLLPLTPALCRNQARHQGDPKSSRSLWGHRAGAMGTPPSPPRVSGSAGKVRALGSPSELSTSPRLKMYAEAKPSLKDTSSYPMLLSLQGHQNLGGFLGTWIAGPQSRLLSP